ncbi:hypothetical protein JCM12294_15040 [Desulfocicer niacini]
MKMRHKSPQRSPGPANSEPKAMTPFALQGAKKRRQFEDQPARKFLGFRAAEQRAADGPRGQIGYRWG